MVNQSIKILLVEDDPFDADLLREMLSEVRTVQFEWAHAERLNDAIHRLREETFDVILLDLSLPDSAGRETLARAYGQAHDIPIVVLTGHSDEALALKTLHEGAQDYLVKGQADPHTLVRSIRYAIERHQLMREIDRGRQQQLKMKDQFLSHVSHELRSPMAVIYQFATNLLDRLAGDLTPEQAEYLEIILRNVNQLRTMIEDLLEVTRAETGKLTINPQWTPLTGLVRETLDTMGMAASAKEIALSVDISGDLPFAYADPKRIRQVLMNLIDNAIKFTSAKGRIAVQARVSGEDPNFLCISVADTGCGIPPEENKKIFESMYQVKDSVEMNRKGLGLGLYICKELVSRHGGRIWVESQPGQGSTFFFTLPIFSLANQLAPILIPKNVELGSLAVVTVEIFSGGRRPLTKSDEAVLREVWDILRQCILIDKDVLLPRMDPYAWKERFFIVACANQNGAEVLVRRIREQLGQCQALQEARLEVTVAFRILGISSKQEGRSSEGFVMEIASGVGELIKKIIQEEGLR
jgi:signal transduction histidine kinase